MNDYIYMNSRNSYRTVDGSVLYVGFGVGFMTVYNYQIYQIIY